MCKRASIPPVLRSMILQFKGGPAGIFSKRERAVFDASKPSTTMRFSAWDRTNNDTPGIVPSMTVASSVPAASTPRTTRTTTSHSLLHNSPAGAVTVAMLGPGACPSHAPTILPALRPPPLWLLMQLNIRLRCGVAKSPLYRITHIACPSLLNYVIV